MSEIPSDHPRFHSLNLRHRLVEGLHAGLASEAGLLAQGRGEAFDYLLGEKTHRFAEQAMAAASARLIRAEHPVLSVNGSAASLAAAEIVSLVKAYPRLSIEVNLFYHAEQRSHRIANRLREVGAPLVLESCDPKSIALPTVQSNRRRMHPDGIGKADVVIVALEDGDRCEGLVNAEKRVIAIDLNPLSRTAQMAEISIIDELTRSLKYLQNQLVADSKRDQAELAQRSEAYDNQEVLKQAIAAVRDGVDLNAREVSEKAAPEN